MRNPKRIPIILEKIDWQLFVDHMVALEQSEKALNEINSSLNLIEHMWKKYPDLRLGQLLINILIIPDSQIAWNTEEVDWMIQTGQLDFEDICFWGKNFDKDGNKLPQTEYITLREVTPDHAQAILDYIEKHNGYLPMRYSNYFKKKASECIKT